MTPDPLAGLRDWHLPGPVSWWPPAPGWWLLAGLALIGAVLAGRRWLRRRRRLAAARAALEHLRRLRAEVAAGGDSRRFAAGVSGLLRRLALIRFPREQVAGLAGRDWLLFLDRTGGGGAFADGVGRVLVDAPFRGDGGLGSASDAEELTKLAAAWIQANRVGQR